MDTRKLIDAFAKKTDTFLKKQSPYAVIAGTLAVGYVLQKTYDAYKDNQNDFKQLAIDTVFNAARYIPGISEYIDNELAKIATDLENGLQESEDQDEEYTNLKKYPVFPNEPLSDEEIQERLNTIRIPDADLSGARYGEPSPEEKKKIAEAWAAGAWVNDMHSYWKTVKLMRKEIISGCQELFHGTPGDPGIITHGGSSSIYEVIGSYARHARNNGIRYPEILVPDSAHIAFDKAGEFTGVRLVKIPIGSDGKVDLFALESAINSNTVLIVASGPSFPYGIIDSIEAIGKIADKRNLPIHVDFCLGGLALAHADRTKFPNLPICDFRINAVKSLATDFHKYYGAFKGTSVLLMKKDCPVRPYAGKAKWMGGMYFSEGIDGSKAGGDITALWRLIFGRGKNYYAKQINQILFLTAELKSELIKHKDIELCFDPELTVLAFKFKRGINPLVVQNRMKLRKKELQVMQLNGQAHALHFCLTAAHLREREEIPGTLHPFVSEFMEALTASIDFSKNNPNEKVKGVYQAYGSSGWDWLPSAVEDVIKNTYCEHGNKIPSMTR